MSEKHPPVQKGDRAVNFDHNPSWQPKPCEDELALQEARNYVQDNNLDHGHLIIERSDNGHYRWIVKIRGTTRWRSRSFALASGKFGLGDTQPFKKPS